MSKPIFENEEQFLTFLKRISTKVTTSPYDIFYETEKGQALYFAKDNGYIKKSDLEVAKKRYNQEIENVDFSDCTFVEQYVYLLEKEIEKLKNDN